MYLPQHFAETDQTVLHDLVRTHPFATWVTQDGNGLLVNHLPMMLDAKRGSYGTLVGHVARANPAWRTADGSRPSIVIFQGPQTYVSPSWYPSKQLHGKVVPTWNYALVHAHGMARAIEDRDRLLAIVTALTNTHESKMPGPWQVSDAPADYVDSMLRAIVGIEIPIDKLVGKWKVSQNRDAQDREGTVRGLASQQDPQARLMAALVKRNSD